MILQTLRKLPRSKKKLVYGLLLVISDIVFLALSYYISYYLRFFTTLFGENRPTYSLDVNYVFYSVIFIGSAIFIFFLLRIYNWDNIYRGSGYYSKVFNGIIINIVIIIITGYLLETFSFSRFWIGLLFFVSIFLIFLSRFIFEAITHKLIRKWDLSSKTLIIGIGENSKRVEDSLSKSKIYNFKILGYIEKKDKIKANEKYSSSFLILGYLEDLRKIVIKNNIQRLIISSMEYRYDEILDMLEDLKGLDVSLLIFPGFFEFSVKRMSMREISGVPLMQISNVGFFGINLFYKNVIDYLLGAILFIVFMPIYLIVGLAIKLDSRGPVFYKQKRFTKNYKEFYMYKFRSMHIDADKRLKELKKYNESDGPLFKMKNDPRTTRVGRFLRKFSIDEIPQILNVLKGELSLVGPRPAIPSEVKKYAEWETKRLNVKQGITGLWQVSGRSELRFEEMIRLDLYYIQNWSISLDIKILVKTIPVALFGRGAY